MSREEALMVLYQLVVSLSFYQFQCLEMQPHRRKPVQDGTAFTFSVETTASPGFTSSPLSWQSLQFLLCSGLLNYSNIGSGFPNHKAEPLPCLLRHISKSPTGVLHFYRHGIDNCLSSVRTFSPWQQSPLSSHGHLPSWYIKTGSLNSERIEPAQADSFYEVTVTHVN